jgi:hypothetical protein
MKMRDRRRREVANRTWAFMPDGAGDTLAMLGDVRRARVALLRQPGMLDQMKAHIDAMPKGTARVLRRMLNSDLRLMRLMGRGRA